jgi:hypothetical protein
MPSPEKTGTLAPMPGKPLLVQRIPDLHAVLGADGKDLKISMRRIHEKGGFFHENVKENLLKIIQLTTFGCVQFRHPFMGVTKQQHGDK